MKKLLGFGLAALVLASCSGDDSDSVNNSVDMGLLQGKWYRVSKTVAGQTIMHDHEECGKDYIEFAANGILKQIDIYSCDGNEPNFFDYEGTYEVDGETVTISIWGAGSSADVQTLTEQKLIVKYEDDFNEDGETETVIEEYTSDPGESPVNEIDLGELTKKWYPTSYQVGGITIPYDDHEDCGFDYVEFFDNGIVENVDIWDCEVWSEETNYTVDGNTLTVVWDGVTMEATILQLSETEFSMEAHYDFDDDGEMDTIIENFVSSMD